MGYDKIINPLRLEWLLAEKLAATEFEQQELLRTTRSYDGLHTGV